MRVVVLDCEQVIADRTFNAGPVTVGSDAESGVHLPLLGIALEHARLFANPNGQWMVQTTDPSCQMEVNGRRLEERCPVYNGDELVIDRFRLKIAVDGDADLGVAGASSLEELARIRDFPLPPGSEVRSAVAPLTMSAEHLGQIVRLARESANCADIDQLMCMAASLLAQMFSAQFVWYGIRRQPVGPIDICEGQTEKGPTPRQPQALTSLEYRCLERNQAILIARKKSKQQESALVVPLAARRGRFGLLYVEASPGEHRYRPEHLDPLLIASSHLACRLEELLLEHSSGGTDAPGLNPAATTAGADVTAFPVAPVVAQPTNPPTAAVSQQTPGRNENEWLRNVQSLLNPKSAPAWPGCQLAVHLKPGRDCGGDLADVMTLPNGMAGLLVVNGQGAAVPTGTALAEVRAAFRIAGLHGDPPRTLLRELNWLAYDLKSDCQIAVTHIVLNPKTGAFEFASAGPIETIIVGSDGSVRALTSTSLDRLGQSRNVEIPRSKERLAKGETLVVFTPGCVKIENASHEPLGRDRFVDALAPLAGEPPSAILEDLHHEQADFFKRGWQPDDITILLLRRP